MALWINVITAILSDLPIIYKIVDTIYRTIHTSDDKAKTKEEIFSEIARICKEKGEMCELPQVSP